MTCKQRAKYVSVWDAREKVESFSSFPWFLFASVKTGIRRVQVKDEKDLSFLCCGINLYAREVPTIY